ncbi:MAG: zinc ribbon domain-containing protein [Methanomassiliicoccales archaeon]|nr:zinc ribbon domain-containing protein [Methanomassiliicoccales archaeon]
MVYCSNCGNIISSDARFCQHCGSKRDATPTAASPLIVEPAPPVPEAIVIQGPAPPVREVEASAADMSEAVRLAKDVIPDHLEKEWGKLLKSGDEAIMRSFFQDKIAPLLVQHEQMTENTDFNPGEEAQWVNTVNTGVFKKVPVEKWIITNQRAIMLKLKTEDRPRSQASVGLAVCDVLIMNQYRKSNSNHVGSFVSRKGVGVGVGQSRSTSTSYGDLVFVCGGKEEFRFPGISDPAGVKRLVETMKKQIKV